MHDIITRKSDSVEQNWLKQLTNAISDPQTLLDHLNIDASMWQKGFEAKKIFPLRVPLSFINRMEKGNPNDPLLRQVLPLEEEFDVHPGYSIDPLKEHETELPGLLHKYNNRVLLILKGGCAVNCRYCFRRHFPYQENKGGKSVWSKNIDYIRQHQEIDEVILSGGDPLMAKDHELSWIEHQIASIEHVKTLRIHTRLPVVIPCRITHTLIDILSHSRLNIVLVSHINHANEINEELRGEFHRLRDANVTLLNQSVLLKGVNDSIETQVSLSQALFSCGIIPYYLNVLDKVQGATHYYVSDNKAKEIMAGLIEQVSGYLVPQLTREVGGRLSKIPLNLNLE